MAHNMTLEKGAKKTITDGFCFTHTYINTKNIIFGFFPSDGGKLSIKTTVEKKPKKKTITSHFSATHTYIKPSL